MKFFELYDEHNINYCTVHFILYSGVTQITIFSPNVTPDHESTVSLKNLLSR